MLHSSGAVQKCLAFLLLFTALRCSADAVIYSWPATMLDDPRGHYPIALLHLALEKAGSHYHPIPSKRDQAQWRTLRQLESGNGMDVVWTFTSVEREEKLLPVRIPIDRGLLGWRLLLIRQQDSERFKNITTSEQLQGLRAVQGHDWPDFAILQHNQFDVIPSTFYAGMFAMLQLGRVDYFPRSLTEIPSELHSKASYRLTIADNLVLHYPAPLYYFVHPSRPQLAQAIEQGLRQAMADGSMQQLFLQHFADAIAQARLTERRIIRLENPFLHPDTPLNNHSLWFNPELGY
ncbi:substrate-binding periplasmic protein [Rheinheimera fenheensis]|uniref:substrate-binding periplasmic protein n=1 Tax=Rheinheimera fenheensis TaxID=3152295 RepID=UPI00325D5F26